MGDDLPEGEKCMLLTCYRPAPRTGRQVTNGGNLETYVDEEPESERTKTNNCLQKTSTAMANTPTTGPHTWGNRALVKFQTSPEQSSRDRSARHCSSTSARRTSATQKPISPALLPTSRAGIAR